MVVKNYLKSVLSGSRFMTAIFMLSVSSLTYASLARTSQKAARSAYRFASSQPNFFELASSSIPQAPEFIAMPQEDRMQVPVKLIAAQPQPKLLGSNTVSTAWTISPEQEQMLNDSVRSYAQGRYDNASKRDQAHKIHFDTMEKSKAERGVITEQRHAMIMNELKNLEKENMQNMAMIFGLPLASLFFIVGLMTQ